MVLIFFCGRAGVEYTVISPAQVTLAEGVRVGRGALLYPNNAVLGESEVGAGTVLYPGNIVRDSRVGENCELTASVLEGAQVGAGCTVGPFAHLRPGAEVGEGCRIGNFVEVKNARIGAGTRVAHLTYIGDAEVGENCNIGCGVVFCNYDGRKKSRTVVGKNCFIGSNVNLVAPVEIGEGSYIAAGTTVTESVPPRSFVIGRSRQGSSETLARRFFGGGNE